MLTYALHCLWPWPSGLTCVSDGAAYNRECMKTYEYYIFDLDGTITDTMVVWLGIYRDGLTQFGVTPPDDKTLSRHTHDWRQMLSLGLPSDRLDDFVASAHQMATLRLPEAPLHAGAYETLKAIKSHGKKIGIYSTLDRPLFESAMNHRDLTHIADSAVAGTDVAKRKPSPDGIIRALSDLRVSKSMYDQAVYIGDKDTDIEAANNAGIDGIAYYPPSHWGVYDPRELKQHHPRYIINDWTELRASLG